MLAEAAEDGDQQRGENDEPGELADAASDVTGARSQHHRHHTGHPQCGERAVERHVGDRYADDESGELEYPDKDAGPRCSAQSRGR